MAAVLKKNCIYVDGTQTITVDALRPRIMGILLTPNAANSRFTLKESVGGTVVLDVTIQTIESRFMTFEAMWGIELTSSFQVTGFTYLDSVILYGNFYQPVNKAVL